MEPKSLFSPSKLDVYFSPTLADIYGSDWEVLILCIISTNPSKYVIRISSLNVFLFHQFKQICIRMMHWLHTSQQTLRGSRGFYNVYTVHQFKQAWYKNVGTESNTFTTNSNKCATMEMTVKLFNLCITSPLIKTSMYKDMKHWLCEALGRLT